MKLENICKQFNNQTVLNNFSVDLKPMSITCLMGPSGCGKTTLLNIISGLIQPDSGVIEFDNSEGFKASYLFQEPRLLEWKTVLENITIPLGGNKEKALEYLDYVGLSDSADKFPSELSGGMKQRVAMARAFSYPSSVILLDEPFQNLDISLKNSLMKLFIALWRKNPRTVIWVSHDATESALVADSIICVSKSPMQVLKTQKISLPQEERTVANTSEIQTGIYKVFA